MLGSRLTALSGVGAVLGTGGQATELPTDRRGEADAMDGCPAWRLMLRSRGGLTKITRRVARPVTLGPRLRRAE